MPTLQSTSLGRDQQAGPVLRGVLDAQAATRAATHGPALTATVDALVAQAHRLGTMHLFGASEIGHSLAGAMAYADPGFQLWSPGAPVEHLLLVDGALAGLAGPRWHMEIAQAQGADRVDALVLGAPDQPAEAAGQAGGRIVPLQRLQIAA